MAADNFVTNIVLDAAMMPELSPREKALRDLFVQQYLIDYDPVSACLRCGFMRSFATEYAEKFMTEPYVRQQLVVHEQTQPLPYSGNPDADDYNKKRIVEGLFREAHNKFSNASARVAALGQLAKIYQLDQKVVVDNNKGKKQHRGGIIMVPQVADVTEWEDVATATQDKLVSDARS
jgi:hypothetical protein